jgi:thiol-disulfide isomerase/thioredoxin
MNRLPVFFLLIGCIAFSSVSAQSNRNILGACTRDSLLQEPFKSWFQKNYDAYRPDESVVAKLKKIPAKDFSVEIFFGTWCGDSRRDVPRFYKIADAIGLPETLASVSNINKDRKAKQLVVGFIAWQRLSFRKMAKR